VGPEIVLKTCEKNRINSGKIASSSKQTKELC
jgi:hypothetical protein